MKPKIKKGCRKQIIKNMGTYSIRTSIKCGDYIVGENKFVYCEECEEKNK